MKEPELDMLTYTGVDDNARTYVAWARENKKRADRLLAAAKAVLTDHDWDWSVPAHEHIEELRLAVEDYENS